MAQSPERWALEKLRAAELLPCPFCGSKAQQLREDGLQVVKCTVCSAQVTTTPDALAFEQWNKRQRA